VEKIQESSLGKIIRINVRRFCDIHLNRFSAAINLYMYNVITS
jgi:hypothetical protein